MFKFDPKTTLVCGAFEGEIDSLRKNKSLPHVVSLGIGNLDAGLGLFQYLSLHPNITSLIFLGSCGAYQWSDVKINSIVQVRSVSSWEVLSTFGDAKQTPNQKEIYTLQPLNDQLRDVWCNAPSSITLLDLSLTQVSEWKDISVENLELYGVTKVAQMFDVQTHALLAVTNAVGKEGSLDWQKNWRELSNTLQTYISSTFIRS